MQELFEDFGIAGRPAATSEGSPSQTSGRRVRLQSVRKTFSKQIQSQDTHADSQRDQAVQVRCFVIVFQMMINNFFVLFF